MKTFKSLPQDSEFFRIYAKFATGIAAGVVISQIISALTEAGIIYQAVYQSLEVFGASFALWGAIAGAALGVAMIELVGLRFFLPQSVDALLFSRFRGLHLPMTLFSFLMAGVLVAGSFYLSIEGKTDLVGNALETAQDGEKAEAGQAHQESRAEAVAAFRQDSSALAEQYAGLLEAEKAKAAAAIEVHKNELALWEGKAARTGRNYESRISKARGQMIEAQAALKATEARLKAELGQRLQQRESRYIAAADSLQATFAGKVDELKGKYQSKGERYGLGAGLIVIIAVAFSIIGIVLARIFHKGAGIEETPLPTDYFFRPGIFAEWYYALGERFQQLTRQAVSNFIARTKEPPELSRIHSLYERDSIEQPRRPIGFNLPSVTNASGQDGNGSPPANATVNNASGQNAKNCLHCGQEYRAKVAWQKYCSTQCKDAYHASQHGGQKFNPGKYHQAKK